MSNVAVVIVKEFSVSEMRSRGVVDRMNDEKETAFSSSIPLDASINALERDEEVSADMNLICEMLTAADVEVMEKKGESSVLMDVRYSPSAVRFAPLMRSGDVMVVVYLSCS